MGSARVIIVGAGVIAAAQAYAFAARGAEVTIVSASPSGTPSFGWVNANTKLPACWGDLHLRGLDAHEDWMRRIPGASWFHQTGSIELIADDADLAGVALKVRRHHARDYQAEMLTRQQIAELEPDLDVSRIVGGCWFAREGWTDVPAMCDQLIQAAVALGARFHPHETVTGFDKTGVVTINESHERTIHHADHVVLAAGNGVRALAATLGRDYPLLEPVAPLASPASPARGPHSPTVGLLCTTAPTLARVAHVIRGEGISIRPDRGRGVVFTDHPTGGSWDRNDPHIWSLPQLFHARAQRLFPKLRDTCVETVGIANRVLTDDGLTIADWLDASRRLYAVTTHSGVTLAPYLANAVADEVLGGVRAPELAPFALSRFTAGHARTESSAAH
ncbi:FAD-binding oxidoreductase [Caballeronia sp. LZ043]|uniref:NAD(P)/FAD-dependent oxidoreductase n=1 Tax=Caballeronia sp. LZ043 TaxID=3038569 RepID=UPI0028617801|nr:FAD-binding oxidoreductase [Caballeronia sp. LZ043]MDR5822332.1 FAD-binding oxidoreductase [Caballeronia sp. LZ043]